MCNENEILEYDCFGKSNLLDKKGVYCPPENLQHWEVSKTTKQQVAELAKGSSRLQFYWLKVCCLRLSGSLFCLRLENEFVYSFHVYLENGCVYSCHVCLQNEFVYPWHLGREWICVFITCVSREWMWVFIPCVSTGRTNVYFFFIMMFLPRTNVCIHVMCVLSRIVCIHYMCI